jgi:hypothetical protein
MHRNDTGDSVEQEYQLASNGEAGQAQREVQFLGGAPNSQREAAELFRGRKAPERGQLVQRNRPGALEIQTAWVA